MHTHTPTHRMGDKATLAMARQELQELYLGIPDDSVDLSFKDFASFQQNEVAEKRKSSMESIREEPEKDRRRRAGLDESPSLDFSKALQASRGHHQRVEDETPAMNKGLRVVIENNHSQVHDDFSVYSMAVQVQGQGRRRQPGIPHSNICALCSVYVYFFRHRCLVCGRVYCRQCVCVGMGEMSEGRKCTECLGRRFSQRYIHKAGQPGCCCWRYPSVVRQQELVWAEKGPMRSGERRYERSAFVSRLHSPRTPSSPSRSYVSRAQSPVMPGTPTKPNARSGPASPARSSAFLRSPRSPHAFPL